MTAENIIWHPEKFLNFDEIENVGNYAIVVLNRPINADKELIRCLWNHASIKITVDGGTNRWISWLKLNNLEGKLDGPNFITGDLDSCSKESLAYFNKSRVIETSDQDETDFTKSLHVLEPFIEEMNLKNVIAVCDTSGRMDHIAANINTLFKMQQKPPELSLPLFILSANSLSWLLCKGQHRISIPRDVRQMWCALIPLEPTIVTTTGLKWNLTNDVLKFGGMVSTSNTYDVEAEVVTIMTDKPFLWSMGISKIDDE